MYKQLLLVGLILFVSGRVNAALVSWDLQDWVYNDGGTASGSFIFDADLNQYSNISIVTTNGSNRSGASYGIPNPDSPGNSSVLITVTELLNDLTGTPVLAASFDSNLTNAGGLVAVALGGFTFEGTCAGSRTFGCGNVTGPLRRLISGSVASVVPVPAAIWLFGTALIGLVGFSKRRKAA